MAGKKAKKHAQHAASDSACEVTLPADCRLAAQVAVQTELVKALERGVPVVLDGCGVERIDTAALQLLLLFGRALADQGGSFSWKGASDTVREAAAALGLDDILELPAHEPA